MELETYATILMDPPWNEQGGGKIKRGADKHYPLLKTKDMPGVINSSGMFNPAKDAHLYMWDGGECSMDALRARLDLSQGVILGNCRSLQRKGFVDIVDGMVSLVGKGQEYGSGL